jgi:hypothetical protein
MLKLTFYINCHTVCQHVSYIWKIKQPIKSISENTVSVFLRMKYQHWYRHDIAEILLKVALHTITPNIDYFDNSSNFLGMLCVRLPVNVCWFLRYFPSCWKALLTSKVLYVNLARYLFWFRRYSLLAVLGHYSYSLWYSLSVLKTNTYYRKADKFLKQMNTKYPRNQKFSSYTSAMILSSPKWLLSFLNSMLH